MAGALLLAGAPGSPSIWMLLILSLPSALAIMVMGKNRRQWLDWLTFLLNTLWVLVAVVLFGVTAQEPQQFAAKVDVSILAWALILAVAPTINVLALSSRSVVGQSV